MENPREDTSTLSCLFDMLFPPVCALCEKALVKEHLCKECTDAFMSLRISSPLCTKCGVPFADTAAGDHACGRCLKKEPPFIRARSAFSYDGIVLEAIHGLKFRHNTAIAPALGRLLAGSGCLPDEKIDVVVPVPLHPERLRERGFNQSLLIARQLAKTIGARLDYTGLRKTRKTKDQIGLDEKDRAENMKGAFKASNEAFSGRLVLLVDDVFTTGATAVECALALHEAGASVYCATLARAGKT